jgi:CubicO group peptidase (beta-lactamase class C family)
MALENIAFEYEYRDAKCTIDEYMRRNRVTGILILKDGAVALERYAMGNTTSTRWTSFSMAKSVTSTLVGAALRDGSISSLDDRAGKYVRELRGSAIADSSIRDLLSMTSGIKWDENYSILFQSDIVRFGLAIASQRRGAVMELMGTRTRAAPSGSVFNYSTGDSYVLGAIVAAATGSSLSDYLSTKIWAPLAMERDGYWLLDAPEGLETGGDEISATLRDYARFGQFFLRDGEINGDLVLPPDGATWQPGRIRRRSLTDRSMTTRLDTATSGGHSRPDGRLCPFTTGPSQRRACLASFFTSTPRRTSRPSFGVRGGRRGTTVQKSKRTQ